MTAPPPRADDVVGQLSEQFTRAFRRMRAGVSRELAPLGLTFSQSRVLRMIGHAEDPLRIGDIAARLEVAPRSATGMVDALESAGLATRRPDTVDRRSVFVELTPRGCDLIGQLAEARRASAQEVFGRLDAGQRAQLLRLLEVLNASSEAAASEAEVR